MNRFRISTLILLGALGAGCATQPGSETAPTSAPPTSAPEGSKTANNEAAPDKERAPIFARRQMHVDRMTEAVLDPTGVAALTLDREGGVRLWTDLHAETVEAPVEVPVREPAWMSVARAGDGFVAAFIDTAGGAQIGRVDVAEGGPTWTPLFDRSPTRPLFEVHVLDGGQRILALAVDHRIELWNARGTKISSVDRPGFVPWQLRVSQAEEGGPKILAVLGRPVRVQRIELDGDALNVVGEARPVALDRGPNRNDLAMSPDGSIVTALRRPKARGKRFEIEITDLKTGARRLVAGESDLGKRPRVHPIDAQRVLLESGSGAGFYLDLSLASPWPPQDADRNAEPDASVIAASPMTAVALPGSNVETRFHSSVAGGTRVVPGRHELVVAPLDDRPARTLRRRLFQARSIALDATGTHVAWGIPGEILLEDRRGQSPMQRVAGTESTPALVAFVDGDRLLSMDDKAEVTLRSLADGSVLGQHKIPFGWGISTSAWRLEPHGGSVVLSTVKPGEPVRVLTVDADGLEAVVAYGRKQRHEWPESGKPRGRESRDWIEAIGLTWDELGLREASVKLTEPDPQGRRIAIVQKTRDVGGFDPELEEWVSGPDEYVLTMFDREDGRRIWTRLLHEVRDLAWSGDGTTFGYVDATGGYVCDAKTGTVLLERHDLGVAAG